MILVINLLKKRSENHTLSLARLEKQHHNLCSAISNQVLTNLVYEFQYFKRLQGNHGL